MFSLMGWGVVPCPFKGGGIMPGALSIKLSNKEIIVVRCKCCENSLEIKPYKKNANGNIVPVPPNISLRIRAEGYAIARRNKKDGEQ